MADLGSARWSLPLYLSLYVQTLNRTVSFVVVWWESFLRRYRSSTFIVMMSIQPQPVSLSSPFSTSPHHGALREFGYVVLTSVQRKYIKTCLSLQKYNLLHINKSQSLLHCPASVAMQLGEVCVTPTTVSTEWDGARSASHKASATDKIVYFLVNTDLLAATPAPLVCFVDPV